MSIQELMRHINESPSSFLQSDCIFQLRAFIRGFIVAKNSLAQGITDDHKLLDSVDEKIKLHYGVAENEPVSIEEVLNDHEGSMAFQKYFEFWFKYAEH